VRNEGFPATAPNQLDLLKAKTRYFRIKVSEVAKKLRTASGVVDVSHCDTITTTIGLKVPVLGPLGDRQLAVKKCPWCCVRAKICSVQ
jgi:hypothetical protein